MTTYMVFQETSGDDGPAIYEHINNVDAPNTTQACRRVAEQLDAAARQGLDEGITLIAVPARNWTSGRHTLKAETQRRIRSA